MRSAKKEMVRQLLFLLPLFVLMAAATYPAGEARADANGMCPLPEKYKVMMEGNCVENVGGTSNNMGDCLHQKNVSDDLPAAANSCFEVKEDEEKTYNFKLEAKNGNTTVNTLQNGQMDDTTKQAQFEWQPKHSSEHDPPMQQGQDGKQLMTPHYVIKGPKQEGHEWDTPGWKIEKIVYVYHMDSPQHYGDMGQMGYNPFEAKTDDQYPKNNVAEPSATKFAYFVPSVPLNYAISSALTMQWKWESQLTHTWKLSTPHIPPPSQKDPDPTCTICQRKFSDKGDKKAQKMSVSRTWHPQEICDGIEDTGVATSRLDSSGKYLDRSGVGQNKVYKSPDKTFDEPSWMCVVARATVKVKDIYNIAHIQTGIEGAGTNLVKAECGKKISEVDGQNGKNIVIRIVDNAVHATAATVQAGETDSQKGEWKSDNFKVTVWYEWPVYQYASYLSDVWKDASGVDKKLIDVAYSPMFVWKKHKTWNSLAEFAGSGNVTTLTYGSDNVDSRAAMDKQTTLNPKIVIYEKKIPIQEFFKGHDAAQEDFVAWHYAETSLGDSVGNPAYKSDVENKLYEEGLNDKKPQDLFSSKKPMNFTKGKGPLKYFVEAHDGSSITKGSGKTGEEEKYDSSGNYMKENEYTHGQLKYNPEVAKYVVYSNNSASIQPVTAIDPTQISDNEYCQAETYEHNKDDIQPGWKKCPVIADNQLNKNVDDAAKLTEYFQAWGRVHITDPIKPNVGLKIVDSVRGTIRRVHKLNDLSRLKAYKEVSANEGQQWVPFDKGVKYNYDLIKGATPRTPFSLNGDNEVLWEFKDHQLLTGSSPDAGKIWEGRDYEDPNALVADATKDSLDPYGTAEDTKLELTHQDLRNDNKKSFHVDYYAHDNIDGQRVVKDGTEIRKEFWYKGLAAIDFDNDNDKDDTFNENIISRGYSSWKIIDETYPNYQSNPVFKKMYMNDNYYKYPEVVFNNPNCKWDGTDLPNGKKEISVAYAVKDKAGNKRKFKLYFYVAPLDMSIQTIEKREKKTGF